MPDQWEHMAITANFNNGLLNITENWPDGRVTPVDFVAGLSAMIQVINRLGLEGWAMVSTDEVADGPYYGRTVWLRRQIA